VEGMPHIKGAINNWQESDRKKSLGVYNNNIIIIQYHKGGGKERNAQQT